MSSLKVLPRDAEVHGEEQVIKEVFDDKTIQTMEGYFHVQDRDVLLKYLRDTLVPSADR